MIGTVKKLEWKYGIDTLIQAFALVTTPQGGVPPILRLVGEGELKAQLQALAAKLGVSERVQFVGPVPHAQVPDQLRGFDVFVAASRLDSESFGVAVIEASSCGLPVVVTRAGGLPEVVLEGKTGLIVERENPHALASALQALVEDPALRDRLGRCGRAHVRANYEWDLCVQRMIDVYRHALQHGHRQQPEAGRVGVMKLLSVIVPCRNEVDFIEAFCASVANQELPNGWALRVVIADGQSDDGTRLRLANLSARDSRFHVIDNPARIVSTGLNAALDRCDGEVIARMDVHTDYASDYFGNASPRWPTRARTTSAGRGARAPTLDASRSAPLQLRSSPAGWREVHCRASSTTTAGSTPSTWAAGRARPSSASAASTRTWCATRTTSTTCASSAAAVVSGRVSRIRSQLPAPRYARRRCSGSTCSTATGSRS